MERLTIERQKGVGAGSEDGRERGGKERERFAVKKIIAYFNLWPFYLLVVEEKIPVQNR